MRAVTDHGADIGLAFDGDGDRLGVVDDLPEPGAPAYEERCHEALERLDVDEAGFDRLDRALLLTLIEKFDGGPVGLDTLAAAIGEDKGTLEDLIEPFLIQSGFLDRTPRGRVATRRAFDHLRIAPTHRPPPGSQRQLL